MKLHLLRHAKTEAASTSGKDFDRALLKKGIEQSKLMNQYLLENKLTISKVFSSDAKRTRQTFSYLKDTFVEKEIIYDNQFYLAENEILLKFINNQTTSEDIFIIGHNNGISDLAEYLTNEFVDLQTCEFISIEFKIEKWNEASQGLGTITERFHPQVLN